jgi:TRAP-type transport system small permease protein
VRQFAARWASRLEVALDFLLGLMVAVMALAVFYQVFGRYVIGRAPAWSEELARFLLLWLVLLGAAAALRSGGHISVTALFDDASAARRRVLFCLRDLLLGAILLLLAWQGYLFAALNGIQASPVFEIPMAVPYAALPISALLTFVQLLLARLSGQPAAVSTGEQIDPLLVAQVPARSAR